MNFLDQFFANILSENTNDSSFSRNSTSPSTTRKKRASRKKTAIGLNEPEELSPLKKRKINEVDNMMEIHQDYHCCNLNCFSKFSEEVVKNLREIVHKMNKIQKKNYIYHKIIRKDGNINKTNKFVCEGEIVCQNCFLKVYGVSRNLIYLKPTADLRIVASPVKRELIGFLEDLGRWHEMMPDVAEIHLPYTTKKEVYEMYSKMFEDTKCSYTYFLSVWKTEMKHLKIRKIHRFTKCGKCTILKERIAESKNVLINKELKKKFRKHVNNHLLDREIYEVNAKLAENIPDEYMSLAIDGADFQRFALPYFSEKDKDTDKGYKIPISLTGVKVHGHGALTWILPSNLPKDPNCTIHCLHETFAFMKSKYDRDAKQWPHTLFIQVIF